MLGDIGRRLDQIRATLSMLVAGQPGTEHGLPFALGFGAAMATAAATATPDEQGALGLFRARSLGR